MEAIKIGRLIKSVLTNNIAVNSKAKGNIFPLVAPEKTLFPFILYARQGVDPRYTKDRGISDTSTVSIDIIDNTYEGANSLAVDVFNALQYQEGSLFGFEIRECRLMDASESYDDAYVQTLVFAIETEEN